MLNVPLQYGTIARNGSQSIYPGLWRGLVGCWPFALGNTGVTVQDVSSRNNGTLESDAVWATDNSIFIGGTTADRIAIGSMNRWPTGSQPRSVFVRARTADTGTGASANNAMFGYGNGTTGNEFYFSIEDTQVSVRVAGGNALWDEEDDLTSDTFQNLVCNVPTGVTDVANIRCYHNGQEMALSSSSARTLNTTASNPVIGCRPSTAAQGNFNGHISVVHFWNRGLDEAEIRLLNIDPLAPLRRRDMFQVYKVPAAGGLSIPIAAYHYKQLARL